MCSILGKTFLPMSELLGRGSWVSGICSLYVRRHILPLRRKKEVKVGGNGFTCLESGICHKNFFSYSVLSLFQLGGFLTLSFHYTGLIKVNSTLRPAKSSGHLSVFLFGLSAALKVRPPFFMKQERSEFPGQQSFPGFSLSHWLVFPSLPACSSSSAGLYVLSFPGPPLSMSLFIHREDVERDVLKFILRRLVPILISPPSTSPLSFRSEYPVISLTSLLGYMILKLMWWKEPRFKNLYLLGCVRPKLRCPGSLLWPGASLELWHAGSVLTAHGLSCPFSDQGSNMYLLPCKVDS